MEIMKTMSMIIALSAIIAFNGLSLNGIPVNGLPGLELYFTIMFILIKKSRDVHNTTTD